MVGPIIVLPSRLPYNARSLSVEYYDYYRRFDEKTGEMSFFYNIRWDKDLPRPPYEIMKNGKVFYYWKTEER